MGAELSLPCIISLPARLARPLLRPIPEFSFLDDDLNFQVVFFYIGLRVSVYIVHERSLEAWAEMNDAEGNGAYKRRFTGTFVQNSRTDTKHIT